MHESISGVIIISRKCYCFSNYLYRLY